LKYWGENKSLDSYLADFYVLRREEDEALSVFNRRFYIIYHDMPFEIWPTEIASMIYYVMGLHSEIALLLLERRSSSLRQLFEYADGVEENICASRRIRERVYFENMHAHEQGNCQYVSDFQQENDECESDLGQQQGCKYVSNYESDSSMIADVSMNMYACQIQENFSNNVEDEIVDDCIDNYMFLIDQNP
jgi:hypothetical protein